MGICPSADGGSIRCPSADGQSECGSKTAGMHVSQPMDIACVSGSGFQFIHSAIHTISFSIFGFQSFNSCPNLFKEAGYVVI